MPIRLEIVTPERAVLTDDVDMVIAPASEGYVGIVCNAPWYLTGSSCPQRHTIDSPGRSRMFIVVPGSRPRSPVTVPSWKYMAHMPCPSHQVSGKRMPLEWVRLTRS